MVFGLNYFASSTEKQSTMMGSNRQIEREGENENMREEKQRMTNCVT